ncbi:MAG: hypothetical protein A2052_06125 [Deltaproteobacteria bacterium GWA2_54_12]|nr:MAG: hypothetical protein A2052_06125 [Deltaproteobacteria bacterium GWA2_54_12]
MYSPSMELLVNKIDRFNEQYAIVENEKAVFSIEYAEFHWDTAANAGCLEGNRYGLVRMARDLMLIAVASGTEENDSHQCATRFEDGSDEIIILKKKPAHKTDDKIRIDWNEAQGASQCSETSYLENILESIDRVVEACDKEETEPAKIEWSEYNKIAFLTGTAKGLVILAREFIQFALSASSEDKYEVLSLQQDSGRLVLVLKDNN